MSVVVRAAKTSDVKGIRKLIDTYAPQRRILSKETVTLYESVQEFVVAVDGDEVVGCGAMHVLWEDVAEVRTVAVSEALRGKGVGHQILEQLIDRARAVGVKKIFCLTFETGFFASHGFEEISDVPVDAATYAELVRSHDEGVAEFLDLARVKQNTLGNTRMLKKL